MKKTVTLTNMEISNAVKALESEDSILKSNSSNKKLPISIWWQISSNYQAFLPFYYRILEGDNKINADYFDEEHSDLSEDGQERIVRTEYREEFASKKRELYDIQNTLDIEVLDISDFGGYDLTPSDYSSIRFMLEDKSNPEAN